MTDDYITAEDWEAYDADVSAEYEAFRASQSAAERAADERYAVVYAFAYHAIHIANSD